MTKPPTAASHQRLSGADVRARLDHPVIDSDGHTVEFVPALLEAVEETAGRAVRQGLEKQLERIFHGWYRMTPSQRSSERASRPPWWPTPTNALDRATATLPGLLHERMPELGIDFSVLYPGIGLFLPSIADVEIRRGGCRAINRYHAGVGGALLALI